MEDFFQLSKDTVLHNLIRLQHVVFEVTDACNLHCKYCAYADLYEGYDQRNNTNMPFHRAKLVIDYLQEIWENNVNCNAVLHDRNGVERTYKFYKLNNRPRKRLGYLTPNEKFNSILTN